MEKMLGSWYKWCYCIKYNLLIASGGFFGNIYQSLGYFSESIVIFYLYFQMIGRRFIRNIFEASAYVISGIVFIFFTHTEILFSWRLLILLAFIPITFSINHFFGIIIGSLAFFFNDSREFSSFAGAYLIFRNTMSGLILPLDKTPAAGFFVLTPYAWVLHHQVQIYLGKYSTVQSLLVFVGGLVWCIILYFLAKIILKIGLKRNESVGL